MKVEQEHRSGTTVIDWLQMDYGRDDSTNFQLKYLYRSDVAGASNKWRQANMHVELRSRETAGAAASGIRTRLEAMDAILALQHDTEALLGVLTEIFVKVPDSCGVALAMLRKSEVSGAQEVVDEPEERAAVDGADVGLQAIAEGDKLPCSISWFVERLSLIHI